MTRDDLHRIDPEVLEALALAAIDSMLHFGTPAGPGHHKAMRRIAKVAIRQARRPEQTREAA